VTITVADPTTCSQIVVPGLVGTGTAFALGGVDVVSVTSPGTDSVGTYGYVDAECTGTACPEHPEAVGYPEAASITGEGLELILGPALGSVTDLFSTGWAENVSLDDIGAKGRTCAIPIIIPETATDVTVAATGRFTLTDRSGSWDSGDLTDGASVILATGPLSGPDTSAFDVVFEGDFTVDVGQTLSFPATPITDITQQVWVLFTVPTREGVEQQQSWLVDEVSVTITYCGTGPDPCAGLDQVPAQLADPVTFTVGGDTISIESLSGIGGIYGPAGHGLIADGTDYPDPAINVAATYGPLAAGTPVHFSVTASLVSPGCTVADDPVVTLVGVIDGVGTALASGSAVDTGGGVWHLSLDHVLAAAWPDVYVIAAVPTGCV